MLASVALVLSIANQLISISNETKADDKFLPILVEPFLHLSPLNAFALVAFVVFLAVGIYHLRLSKRVHRVALSFYRDWKRLENFYELDVDSLSSKESKLFEKIQRRLREKFPYIKHYLIGTRFRRSPGIASMKGITSMEYEVLVKRELAEWLALMHEKWPDGFVGFGRLVMDLIADPDPQPIDAEKLRKERDAPPARRTT